MKGPVASEHVEQVNLFRWAHYAKATAPELALLYAIPNGGARHPAVAAKLRAEGVKPGVPDLHLPVPRGTFHGLYIELKRVSGSRPTKEQREWLEKLETQGYRAVWCRGWHHAKDVIEEYLAAPNQSKGRGNDGCAQAAGPTQPGVAEDRNRARWRA